ncbi:MAG: asparagine synthase (glutamine-hydrolyzing) [Algiphilus sp.]
MCGVGFLHAPALERAEQCRRIKAGMDALQHRGPDGEGVQSVDGAVLGHRRLSIIDLAGSPQPMASPEGRYHLTYNGEIYNYRELRRQLAGRWAFRSDGDTEVLLAGLVLHGAAFLHRMEGMWGFCFWDASEGRLLAARDRMGKKPLFYTQWGDVFAAASELSALEQIAPDADWSEDLDSTADYFRYGFTLPGWTFYRDIREIPPGHFLEWQSDDPTPSVRQWWTLKVGGWSGSFAHARDQIANSFHAAVDRRLVADVEVGAFLSGGVDSSLVCASASQRHGGALKSFTIAFSDPRYDESGYAASVAGALGTDHHCHEFPGWDLQTLTALVLGHVGQPFADPSLLPTGLVSQVAAEYVKVALSGDGGDELFCGYERYHARTLLRWYTSLPATARRGVGRVIRSLPEPMAHHSRSLLKKAHLFQDVVDRHGAETPYIANHIFPPAHARQLFPQLQDRGHKPPPFERAARADDLLELMYADALVYLPQDILVKVDRTSMAHSLEVRCPFLDSHLVEMAFSVPATWHRRGMKGKQLLRAALGSAIPPSIWERRKQGFGVPIHEWFRSDLGAHLSDLLNTCDAPVESAGFDAYLRDHRSGKRDHGFRLWNVYNYLLWKSNGARPRS